MAKKNHVSIETTGFFRGTPERISPLGDKPRIRGAQQKTCLTAGFFVVRPSGFPLSGINLESAAHSKKTCLTAGFFVVRPSGFPLSGINLESAAHSKKTCLTAGFFVVRPSGFEPLAYRVGVCHSIQLSYGRIFSRSYYSKVRPKSKADFLFPFGGGYAILRKKQPVSEGHTLYEAYTSAHPSARAAAVLRAGAAAERLRRGEKHHAADL